MFSAKVLGNNSGGITSNSTHKANFHASVKAKKAFSTKQSLKK